jgi:uncharacterized membrane protein YtjA (UPF0391 family)
MADGDCGGSVPYRIIPPPPPPMMRALSFFLALVAALLGFGGYSLWAGIAAGLSLVTNVWDFFANRGVVQIPRSQLDAEGKLKIEDVAGSRQ